MIIPILDFETVDPYINRGLGAGWVYKLNVPTSDFRPIGFSLGFLDTDTKIISDIKYYAINDVSVWYISETLELHKKILCHNAQYELGILLTLGIDISKLQIFDTKIIAQLYDNRLFSYSLDPLSKKYLPIENQKKKSTLIDIALSLELFPDIKPTINMKPRQLEKYIKNVEKWCYSNMDILQEHCFDEVAYYANQDIIATGELFKFFTNTNNPHCISLSQAEYWSYFQKIEVERRKLGIKIDIHKLRNNIAILAPVFKDLHENLIKILAIDNPNSSNQLGKALECLGYDLKKTPTGRPSTSKKSFDEFIDDPTISLINEYRSINILLNNFCQKILDIQQYSWPDALLPDSKWGRIYPEMNVFGAENTGRYSSSCPNIQNIPIRSKYGKLIREMFVCENGQQNWFKLDWSNQEGRLQVHYANRINAIGAKEMINRFKENPKLDLHQKVADLANITRDKAKPINLGISYGMQSAALARSLKLKTKWITAKNGNKYEVAGDEAQIILDKYHKAVPFIQQLIDSAKKVIQDRGYIITIAGRRLYRDPDGRDYTGVSKLIQGSAADLMYRANREAYELGLRIPCIIHDEFNVIGTLKDAQKMQKIMESTYELDVPMIAEIKQGTNWGNTE